MLNFKNVNKHLIADFYQKLSNLFQELYIFKSKYECEVNCLANTKISDQTNCCRSGNTILPKQVLVIKEDKINMPEVKLERVVSVSSEDPIHKAENLLKCKKWRSANAGESQVRVVLQLSKASVIKSIDVGNNGSAFVEVQVSRQASPDEFKTILVASSFLTPLESRNENNLCRVRMFPNDKLNADIAKEKWDLLKILCTQPFNKNLKYGISFITVHSAAEEIKNEQPKVTTLGAFKLKDEDDDDTGELFNFNRKLLTQPKESVATSIRSETTLQSLALHSSQAEAKRDHRPLKTPKIPPSKAKIETPKEIVKKHKLESPKESPVRKKIKIKEEPQLPRRNVLEPEKKASVKNPEPIKQHSTEKFDKLMSNVVFVLSGFQNPLRGEIRQKALEMGAKYRADWDNSCTHLVCAFANTPKFNQVKGKGKIIKKDWIEKCHRDRKRYPWRRYCLDKADQGQPESEDEVWEDDGNVSVVKKEEVDKDTDDELDQIRNAAPKKDEDDYDKDTDDEIEDIRKKENENSAYDQDTDQEEEKKDDEDPYEADTDVDEEQESDKKADKKVLPPLPEFYKGLDFFIYGQFKFEKTRKSIIRGIIAAGGKVKEYMGPEVSFVISANDWDSNFKDALDVNPKVQFVRPSFIQSCFDQDKLISPSQHLITNEN